MNKLYAFLLLGFFCLFLFNYQPSNAQETIPDSLQRQQADSLFQARSDTLLNRRPFILFDSLSYRLSGDGNFTRGNINRSLIILRAEIIYNGPIVALHSNPRFTYGEQSGILAERDIYVDLFVDIYKKRRIYGFGLATVETSNLRGINLRRLAGAGAGFRILETNHHSLVVTNALIYESTNFRERQDITTLRNSTRIRSRHAMFQNRARLLHTTFIQPSLYDISNLRWSTIISLELPLSRWFILRSSFENTYESIVDPSRRRNDSRLTIGFSIGNRL